jgi:hypothetical protein
VQTVHPHPKDGKKSEFVTTTSKINDFCGLIHYSEVPMATGTPDKDGIIGYQGA